MMQARTELDGFSSGEVATLYSDPGVTITRCNDLLKDSKTDAIAIANPARNVEHASQDRDMSTRRGWVCGTTECARPLPRSIRLFGQRRLSSLITLASLEFIAFPGLVFANSGGSTPIGTSSAGAHNFTAAELTQAEPAATAGTVTDGAISSFSSANDSTIMIGGLRAHVQNANQSWSLTSPDTRTLRFEVRSGDHWSNAAWSDLLNGDGAERSEIDLQSLYKSGAVINVSYRFMIEAGPKNTSPWLVIGQFHQTKARGSPPFAVAMYGEHMYIIIRDRPGKEKDIYADPSSIKRGQYYSMSIQVKFGDMTNGALNVWRDGVKIVSYRGAIGYGADETYYWKQGIYRGRGSAEPIAVNYKDLRVTAVPSELPQE